MSLAVGGNRALVEHVMGTAVSLRVIDGGPQAEQAAAEFFAWLRHVDADFSTYKADSLVSRVRGESLRPEDAGPEFQEVFALCEEARRITEGAFDPWRHSRDGYDPSGLVKGWALERGAALLAGAGLRDFCVNGGGDVIAAGSPGKGGSPWRVGIRHPWDPGAIATVVEVRDLAVATSALYERGPHIRDPRSWGIPGELGSTTVVGPSMTWADTFATAVFVKGRRGIPWIDRLPGYEAMAIAATGDILQTPGFAALRASA